MRLLISRPCLVCAAGTMHISEPIAQFHLLTCTYTCDACDAEWVSLRTYTDKEKSIEGRVLDFLTGVSDDEDTCSDSDADSC